MLLNLEISENFVRNYVNKFQRKKMVYAKNLIYLLWEWFWELESCSPNKNLIFPRELYESMAGTRERSKELAATIFNYFLVEICYQEKPHLSCCQSRHKERREQQKHLLWPSWENSNCLIRRILLCMVIWTNLVLIWKNQGFRQK